ncbi:hypothetical protein WOLCODRAFT_131634 [Wolfiporia cocos MD-104 SS10]|uniref:Uncharacterized protein n=1 Tax=Wolfiporia cocos (strain MD-104) TaxID=742152 RepID=A0A2H3JW90_WOLCO|nr:hypothetical protein WOLCODRAFT_131634 [Wolfiporia cocos MD-104 SS10]
MKPLSVVSTLLACALCASAQYFSEGWKPGQPVPTGSYEQQPAAVQSKPAGSSRFNLTNIFTEGAVGSLMGKLGVNMTERLEKAKAEAEVEIWDTRIPLITDDNYEEIIVNEPLSPEEEADRVWFLIISVSKSGKNAFSKKADEHFDNAYNKSMVEGDLPNIRWGRIDYVNVTYITTKWSIWQGPYIVVLTDRGQNLRFYKANTVRLDPDVIRDFLKEEGWRESEPWSSPFAPGGQWEYIMHYFAVTLRAIYEFLLRFPRWLLMIASGGIAQVVMRFLHKSAGTDRPQRPTPRPPAKPASPPAASVSVQAESSLASLQSKGSPSKGRGKQRKGAQK